jgi:dihydroneopterin aldolase
MSLIAIEGMEFYASIGYYSEERMARGKFSVDAYIDLDTSVAAGSDALQDTVNYERLYDICAEKMKGEYDLIETVAHEIAQVIISQWPHIEKVKIRVVKWNPPLPGSVNRTFVEIETK